MVVSILDKEAKWRNANLPIEERVDDLVGRMTLAEKVAQMGHEAPAIERLGLPDYNWWNEALHGVGRAGTATVFPQAIGLAATFNEELIYDVADVVSDEARAKYHQSIKHGDRGIYKGLTLWSPNINIFRDPRWGRGHETYGEDPYLTGRMGAAYVKGLQGTDEKYLKTIATPKHIAAHSGPEAGRDSFNSIVSQKDLRDTYLPAFKECVKEGKAASIMGAYNRVNGEACCASKTLLIDILRKEWGFDGFVVSDCGAICNLHNYHKLTNNAAESAALAVNNGCELNCGSTYGKLVAAVTMGLISEEKIDESVKALFKARFKLGMFDNEEEVSYTKIPYEIVDCKEHDDLSLKAAQESMVLLKNKDNFLPISNKMKSIAVIGPNAFENSVLLGNYHGMPSKFITPLDGIRSRVSEDTRVYYAKGCDLTSNSKEGFAEALAAAENSDVVVMCLGLAPTIEGEAGDAYNSQAGGDKPDLNIPGQQQELLEEIYAVGKPVILVLVSGSALAVNWADEHVSAIMQAWYPGQQGGSAIADVIFGNCNPSGRLPVTFYRTAEELPDICDYSMKGRTYRYMENEALYPFGFGLSYTKFGYNKLKLSNNNLTTDEALTVSVEVENTGKLAGNEAVELYISDIKASTEVPKHKLVGLKKIYLQPGETKAVSFVVTPRQMALIDDQGNCILEAGSFKLHVGGSQPDNRSCELKADNGLTEYFEVIGENLKMEY
jgi:beta-glucosidase